MTAKTNKIELNGRVVVERVAGPQGQTHGWCVKIDGVKNEGRYLLADIMPIAKWYAKKYL